MFENNFLFPSAIVAEVCGVLS